MKRRMIADSLIYQYQRCAESKLKQSYDGRCITMFHQIEDDVGKWYDSRYAISFSSFTIFIEKLQEAGYEIVSPYNMLNSNGKKRVVLSFDDVFDGVYYFVYPFLKQRNIPFVIFPAVCKLHERGFVNERMLIEMANEYSGCYVGAHSISHCNLRYSSKEKSKKEIVESGEIIGKIIGKAIDIFAYPYGSLDAVGKRERKIAGQKYHIAFGTLQGGMTDKSDLAYLPRININEENFAYKII